MFKFAGGEPAFLALAAATHERCLEDPALNHPFSHGMSPHHIENLAAYWAEVLGGPPRYSNMLGGHSGMLSIHAGEAKDRKAVLLGLRYVLLGGGAYVILKYTAISLPAALAGLFIPAAAVIVEILIQLVYARN